MARLAIIPARSGSKRIANKNIRPFLGKPIIHYTIKAALDSGLFDIVMVSTDSKEIAQIAKEAGADVPFMRSEKNSNDFATTFDVIEEVMEAYSNLDQKFEHACCLYAAAPFISAKNLKAGYELLVSNNLDSVFPAIPYNPPIQRAFKKNGDGLMELISPEYKNSRSQDLSASYHDAGQFYWFVFDRISEQKSLWTNNTGLIEIEEHEGHDIDSELDWAIAETKYRLLEP